MLISCLHFYFIYRSGKCRNVFNSVKRKTNIIDFSAYVVSLLKNKTKKTWILFIYSIFFLIHREEFCRNVDKYWYKIYDTFHFKFQVFLIATAHVRNICLKSFYFFTAKKQDENYIIYIVNLTNITRISFTLFHLFYLNLPCL